MVKGIAISTVVVVIAFYFLLRPSFINGTVLEDGTTIQTHVGFCYHPLGAPIPIRSRIVPVQKDVEPIQNANGRSTDRNSCAMRHGMLFGLLLPFRETIVVEVP